MASEKYPRLCPECGGCSFDRDSDPHCVTRWCADCGVEIQPVSTVAVERVIAKVMRTIGRLPAKEADDGR